MLALLVEMFPEAMGFLRLDAGRTCGGRLVPGVVGAFLEGPYPARPRHNFEVPEETPQSVRGERSFYWEGGEGKSQGIRESQSAEEARKRSQEMEEASRYLESQSSEYCFQEARS